MLIIKRILGIINNKFFRFLKKPATPREKAILPEEYWGLHTVFTPQKELLDAKSSLDYFHWRCEQYPGYLNLMPVKGFDNRNILDFGCGPGHDLVGFSTYSTPNSLWGVDVSLKALSFAKKRLNLHNHKIDIVLKEFREDLKLPTKYFDYIHSSGVLHHVPNLLQILNLFYESLKDDGRVRIMVYNRDSLWWNLYVPYELQIKKKIIDTSVPLEVAFRMSTDGLDCPIAEAYTLETFDKIASNAGFETKEVGASLSLTEIRAWRKFEKKAKKDQRLDVSHREFLEEIETKENLTRNGKTPGINLVLELKKS